MDADGETKDPKKQSKKTPLQPSVTYNISDVDGKEEICQGESPDCAVCLQPSLHPVQLPCAHIFCFLCVKGAASRNRRCALCRQEIPPDFFLRPNLLQQEEATPPVVFDEGYQWYYEGVNGWWQYDARTSLDLEAHHKKGDRSCELLIAGFVYIIDFENMVQYRQNDRTKKRRIKRDLINIPGKKGIAGLKIGVPPSSNGENDRPSADGTEGSTPSSGSRLTQGPIPISQVDRTGDQSLSPPTPYNTPLTPQTPSESPPTGATTERDLSIHLERLRLADNHPLSEEGSSEEDAEISAGDHPLSSSSALHRQGHRDSHSHMQEIASAIYDQMESLEDRDVEENGDQESLPVNV
ncbi:E3 ubiquitin-protein ligase RNF146-B-like [Babylonia areolata]|uniref:E3 ubiquitin-protein ligase RNF146-B-like n=1 Tax=Babylonia areolata TaxID=304850 RepID=UPI003FD440D4